MALLIILLVLGALDLCWFLFERVKEKSTKAAMIKSSVSVLFMSVAAVAWSLFPAGAAHAKFAPFLVIGLLCGLLGDIWLDLKWVYPKENDIYTFAGFYAFAAGNPVMFGDPTGLGPRGWGRSFGSFIGSYRFS